MYEATLQALMDAGLTRADVGTDQFRGIARYHGITDKRRMGWLADDLPHQQAVVPAVSRTRRAPRTGPTYFGPHTPIWED